MPNIDRCVAPASQRRFWVALGLVVAVALGGCGNLKLHSELRQKQGEAAAKAWSDVDLKAFFDAERANQAKLLSEENEGLRRLAAANRETQLRILSITNVDALARQYDKQLSRLVVDGPLQDPGTLPVQKLTDAWEELEKQRGHTRDAEQGISFLRSMGVPGFGCALLIGDKASLDAWIKANDALAKRAATRLKNTRDSCASAKTARDAYFNGVSSVNGGKLKEVVGDWQRAKTTMDTRELELGKAQAAYALALADFNAEAAKAKAGTSTVEKAAKLAKDAAEKLQLLEKTQQAFGIELASAERLRQLDELLASLQEGKPLDAETASKGEFVASMLPRIAQQAKDIGQARKGRSLVPLLIQRDIEQANLNAATVLVAIQRKDLALREAIVVAVHDQALTYLKARNMVERLVACSNEDLVGDVPKCKGVKKDARVHAVWDRLPPAGRKTLLESTTLYLDAFSRQQERVNSMTTQYLALERERNVELSAVNASMWSSLIGTSVSQAAEFAALGLKVEHFEKLLNILGIFYIGHGVNN